MEFIKKNRVIIILAIIGMIGGFLYWRFIGCLSGTCPVKSVWYWSTLYGGAAGVLLGSIINDLIIKFRKKKETEVE